MKEKIDIIDIVNIAVEAGKNILKVYNDPKISSKVEFKHDNSPLTIADKLANDYIVKELVSNYPDIPIISEEGKDIPYDLRKNWDYFWLVDPLDGTKEFVKRNGQFTVNIALIYRKSSVLGVIHAPVLNETWYGSLKKDAGKITSDGQIISISTRRATNNLIAVRSSSHAVPEEDEVLKHFPVSGTISTGSSLKFCMVAEGKADVYYRHGPTMEWDTAAGQAIVEAAGGKVNKGSSLSDPFVYNKENLLNGGFLVLG